MSSETSRSPIVAPPKIQDSKVAEQATNQTQRCRNYLPKGTMHSMRIKQKNFICSYRPKPP
ncbi:MAG TPA: hypothetical protein VK671_05740, partial [Mucilaginibacter sp.]|nr:hypothetical protein [Mucilaginibacter sp.]